MLPGTPSWSAVMEKSPVRALLIWMPRVLALAFALFVSAFALDVFDGRGGPDLIASLTTHLAPAVAVLAAALIGWRWPVAGGALFALLGAAYVLLAGPGRPISWYVVIAGPAFIVGLLYIVSQVAGSRARPN